VGGLAGEVKRALRERQATPGEGRPAETLHRQASEGEEGDGEDHDREKERALHARDGRCAAYAGECGWPASEGAASRTNAQPTRDVPASPERALGAEIREHREDAVVILGGGREAQLPEDARHVLLDGAFGDDEPLGDARVRASLGHQLEDLALARR
jgi:hypothetical protein